MPLVLQLVIYLKVSAVLFVYIAVTSIFDYKTLINISKQLENPVSHYVKVSQLLPCIVGIIGAAWHGLGILAFFCAGLDHAKRTAFMLGFIDFIFVALLAVSATMQSSYLPHSLAACRNPNLQLDASIHELFTKAAVKNSSTFMDECHDFVLDWILLVSLSALLSVTCMCGILGPHWKGIWKVLRIPLLPLGYFLVWTWPVTKPILVFLSLFIVHPLKYSWWTLKKIGHFLVWSWPVTRLILVFLSLPIVLPVKYSWWVLKRTIPAVRYCTRYIKHFFSRNQHSTLLRKWNVSCQSLLTMMKDVECDVADKTGSYKLQDMHPILDYPTTKKDQTWHFILHQRKYVLLIVPHAHFADIINLSLVSKDIRKSVLAVQASQQQRITFVRQISCHKGSKSQCWCCGLQICPKCSSASTLGIPQTTPHLYHCEPQCSSCYFSHSCLDDYYSSAPCRCWNGRRDVAEYVKDAKICSNCERLPKSAALALVEERERFEMFHLLRQSLRCAVCTRRLAETGPRWWGCSVCKGECRSEYHPAWSKGAGV